MAEHPPLHWFPFDLPAWLASPAVAMMLPEQEGAYLRLLLLSWGNGTAEPSLPTDPQQLAQLSRLGSRWKKLGGLVLEQFELRGDRYVNARLAAVWWEQQEKYAGVLAKASAGGKAKAAKRRASGSAPSTAPGTAPSTPQAVLELCSSGADIEQEEGVLPAPEGAGVVPPSAPDGAPAPADAAPRATGSGDYLDRPALREELARRGLRPGPDAPPAADAAAHAEALAARQAHELAHFTALKAAAWRWMRANRDDSLALGRQVREALGFPLEGHVTGLKADTLEAEMLERIRSLMHWPAADEWDGVSPFDLTPSGVSA